MKKTKRQALYRSATASFRGIVSVDFDVREVSGDAIGYTVPASKKATIYVNPDHPIYKSIEDLVKRDNPSANQDEVEDYQMLFLLGVLTHEMLHTCYTDPRADEEVMRKMSVKFGNFFHEISNITEDQVIEYRGLRILPPNLRHALSYSIYTVWRLTPPVEGVDTLWGQVRNALIQFGDMGIIRNNPAEKTEEVLDQLLPIMYGTILEPPLKRSEMVFQMYEVLLRYLDMPEEAENEAAKTRSSAGEMRGANPNASRDRFNDPDGSEGENDVKKQEIERRAARAAKRAEKSESDSESEESSKAPAEPSDGEEKESDELSKESGQAPENASDGASDGVSGGDEKESDTVSSNDGCSGDDASDNSANASDTSKKSDDSSDGSAEDEKKGDTSQTKSTDSTHNKSDADDGNGGADEGEHPSDEEGQAGSNSASESEKNDWHDIKMDFRKGIQEMNEAIAQSEAEIKFSPKTACTDEEKLKIPTVSGFYGGVDQKNYVVRGITPEIIQEYESIRDKNMEAIRAIGHQLRKMVDDQETLEWAKSGRISLQRYARINSTARVFQKYTAQDRKDSRVCILLDVSGSMGGPKIQAARTAAICIAEAMHKAGLPLKVITFTEQYGGDCPVIHRHYVNYKSSLQERAALALIHAEDNNFDGFSIRYAAKDILREKAAHNLLIVISDGQPACIHYRDRDNALSDVKAAVEEAKKKMKVIGIGIDADLPILKGFYKETFVQMTNMKTLMTDLGRLILKEVATW